jgi:hypothetical protein
MFTNDDIPGENRAMDATRGRGPLQCASSQSLGSETGAVPHHPKRGKFSHSRFISRHFEADGGKTAAKPRPNSAKIDAGDGRI